MLPLVLSVTVTVTGTWRVAIGKFTGPCHTGGAILAQFSLVEGDIN